MCGRPAAGIGELPVPKTLRPAKRPRNEGPTPIQVVGDVLQDVDQLKPGAECFGVLRQSSCDGAVGLEPHLRDEELGQHVPHGTCYEVAIPLEVVARRWRDDTVSVGRSMAVDLHASGHLRYPSKNRVAHFGGHRIEDRHDAVGLRTQIDLVTRRAFDAQP